MDFGLEIVFFMVCFLYIAKLWLGSRERTYEIVPNQQQQKLSCFSLERLVLLHTAWL